MHHKYLRGVHRGAHPSRRRETDPAEHGVDHLLCGSRRDGRRGHWCALVLGAVFHAGRFGRRGVRVRGVCVDEYGRPEFGLRIFAARLHDGQYGELQLHVRAGPALLREGVRDQRRWGQLFRRRFLRPVQSEPGAVFAPAAHHLHGPTGDARRAHAVHDADARLRESVQAERYATEERDAHGVAGGFARPGRRDDEEIRAGRGGRRAREIHAADDKHDDDHHNHVRAQRSEFVRTGSGPDLRLGWRIRGVLAGRRHDRGEFGDQDRGGGERGQRDGRELPVQRAVGGLGRHVRIVHERVFAADGRVSGESGLHAGGSARDMAEGIGRGMGEDAKSSAAEDAKDVADEQAARGGPGDEVGRVREVTPASGGAGPSVPGRNGRAWRRKLHEHFDIAFR
mmetsp:Transcript_21786/g.54911  ORF Transcript_21786/g.54911 Transcript_21786/m.54911 type:complete len:396 (+) Transcript_21786:12561-13748(+)